jgi:hypothetical protein
MDALAGLVCAPAKHCLLGRRRRPRIAPAVIGRETRQAMSVGPTNLAFINGDQRCPLPLLVATFCLDRWLSPAERMHSAAAPAPWSILMLPSHRAREPARPTIGHGRTIDPPARLNYDLWQGPAPREPYRDNVIHYHWHWFWTWGTGELGNNGIHGLDLCRLAMQVDCPRQVVCGGGKLFFDDDQQTPDTELATYRFGEPGHDEKLIHWEHRTWHRHGGHGRDWGVEFYGDIGTLTLDSAGWEILDRDGKQTAQVKITGGEPEHLANFCAAIRSGTPLQAPIAEGVSSTLLCHLGNIAYRTGRTVNLDPATKQLAANSDSEQQQLWSREYVPGWEVKV